MAPRPWPAPASPKHALAKRWRCVRTDAARRWPLLHATQASDARSKAERREAKKKAQKQKQKEDEARLLGVAAPGAASDPPVAPA